MTNKPMKMTLKLAENDKAEKPVVADYADGSHEIVMDTAVDLADIQNGFPKFFETRHGERETYEVHRGVLIVRNTVRFTGRTPERWTAIYIYDTKKQGLRHMGGGSGFDLASERHAINAFWERAEAGKWSEYRGRKFLIESKE